MIDLDKERNDYEYFDKQADDLLHILTKIIKSKTLRKRWVADALRAQFRLGVERALIRKIQEEMGSNNLPMAQRENTIMHGE